MASISYEEIVVEQIENAIYLFHKEQFISATTLAGAAEEILGEILKRSGKDNAVEIALKYVYHRWPEKQMKDKILNFPRNAYKHYKDCISQMNTSKEALATKAVLPSGNGRSEFDIKEEAESMILRAIFNYRSLRKDTNVLMSSFYDSRVEQVITNREN